jgi:hypothetical protein
MKACMGGSASAKWDTDSGFCEDQLDSVKGGSISQSAQSHYEASTLVNAHLIASIRGREKFRHAEHVRIQHYNRTELRARNNARDARRLEEIDKPLPSATRRIILRGKATGAILHQTPSESQCHLDVKAYLDGRCARTLRGLPSHCDGCGQRCTVSHALKCRKGGNIIMRHNDVKYALIDLAKKALCPSAVRDEPLINPCRPASEQETPT